MKMCGEKIKLISSYKAPDRMVGREIVRGKETEIWRTCGKRPGHRGAHGPWSRLRRWRFKIENLLKGQA